MRTTVRLPDDLMTRAKQVARREGRTLTGIIEQGVRHVVDKTSDQTVTPRKAPVSSVKSKCLVDLSSLATVLDMLDEETPFEKLR